MNLDLKGKVALVTGAGRGIGRSIAQHLASEGAVVVLNDLSEDRLRDAAAAIRQAGGEVLVAPGDVGSPDAVARVFAEAEAWKGGVDVLVNNAGIVSRKTILDVGPEEWGRVLRTNLDGCFHCSRAAAGSMCGRGRGGRIVNISSMHGQIAKAGMGSYCASKSAIDGFTRQLAVELAPNGIAVNAVACGAIRTEINLPLYQSTAPEDRALQQALLRRIPAGAVGEPEDIAHAVAFLASATAARYITGTILNVDGGYVADGTPHL